MGDVYSSGYNNLNATPPVKEKANKEGGRVRIYEDTYTQGAADGAIGDVIHFKKLPEGARILPGAKMFNSAGNATAALTVGVTGSPSKFLTAFTIAAAASTSMEAHLASGADYETPAGGIEVIGTNATAAIKATQVITLWIPYVID